jgi:hypothetical protein
MNVFEEIIGTNGILLVHGPKKERYGFSSERLSGRGLS